jgi:uncharacterized protein YxeA
MKPILNAILLIIAIVAISMLVLIKQECGDRQAVVHKNGSYECTGGRP